jgi:hypothetical protein
LVVVVVILLVAALLGALAGGAVCVRYLRQEIAADLGPRLRRIELQLDNLEGEINLVMTSRLAELTARLEREPRKPDDK